MADYHRLRTQSLDLTLRAEASTNYGANQLFKVITEIRRNSRETTSLWAGDFYLDLSRGSVASLIASTQLDSSMTSWADDRLQRLAVMAKCAAIDWIYARKSGDTIEVPAATQTGFRGRSGPEGVSEINSLLEHYLADID